MVPSCQRGVSRESITEVKLSRGGEGKDRRRGRGERRGGEEERRGGRGEERRRGKRREGERVYGQNYLGTSQQSH